MQKRYHLFFSGSVQGVGFRYTARSLADKYGINGWAENLTDGRVELEIEGSVRDLNNFIEDLHGEFKDYIKGIEKEELPFSGENKSFYIKSLR